MLDKWLYNFFGFIDTIFNKIDEIFIKQKKNENKRKH